MGSRLPVHAIYDDAIAAGLSGDLGLEDRGDGKFELKYFSSLGHSKLLAECELLDAHGVFRLRTTDSAADELVTMQDLFARFKALVFEIAKTRH